MECDKSELAGMRRGSHDANPSWIEQWREVNSDAPRSTNRTLRRSFGDERIDRTQRSVIAHDDGIQIDRFDFLVLHRRQQRVRELTQSVSVERCTVPSSIEYCPRAKPSEHVVQRCVVDGKLSHGNVCELLGKDPAVTDEDAWPQRLITARPDNQFA